MRDLHSGPAAQDDGNLNVWAPTRRFFELPEARRADLGGTGSWYRWSEEIDFDIDGGVEDSSDG